MKATRAVKTVGIRRLWFSRPAMSIAMIASAALAVRLALFGFGAWEPNVIDNYDRIAGQLVHGNGFSFNGVVPTVCRAPVYPLYLAGILLITQESNTPYTAFRMADIILDAVSAVLIYLLARTWFRRMSDRQHLLSGLLYALNPFAAYYAVKLGSETLQIFFLALYFLVLHHTITTHKNMILSALALGLAGGILILNKSVFLPILFILFPVLMLRKDLRNRRTVRTLMLALLMTILILVPWVYRNVVVSNRIILVQTLVGFNFWYDFTLDENRNKACASGDPDFIYTGGKVVLPGGAIYEPYGLPAPIDAQNDALLVSRALEWASANPGLMLQKVADNFLGFWYVVETPRKMFFAGIFSIGLILLSLFGFIAARIEHPFEASMLLGIPFLIALLYSPALGVFRYSLLTYPFLSILMGAAVDQVLRLGLRRTPINEGVSHT